MKSDLLIGIVGLGYVGLPLAIEFAKNNKVIGFDLNYKRVNELRKKIDRNNDVSKNQFTKAKKIFFTNKIINLKEKELKIYIF